jgi:hypothetical protein
MRESRLLAPGNETEWAEINRSEERQDAEFSRALNTVERLEFGQRLCDQAFELYNSVKVPGDVTRRDPRA